MPDLASTSVATRDAAAGASPQTIPAALEHAAASCPDQPAFTSSDGTLVLSWAAVRDLADELTGGFARLGLERGEVAALMIGNRPEFHVVDLAVARTGATTFSIYSTLPTEEVAYLLAHSGARIIVCEWTFLEVVRAACARLDKPPRVILLEGDGPPGVLDLDAVRRDGVGVDTAALAARIEPTDVLTLIYTSGTTGRPKGVELTHRSVIAVAHAMNEVLGVPPGGRLISYLPSAHIGERQTGHYIPIVNKLSVRCCRDIADVLELLRDVEPDWFFSVPRIYEKLRAAIETEVESRPPDRRALAQDALERALAGVRARSETGVVGDWRDRLLPTDERILAEVRHRVGFGRVRSVHVGGAPVPVGLAEFFLALGVPFGELWGMSECSGGGTMTRPEAIKPGSAGAPMPGHEIASAPDGELLFRGPGVMRGYRAMPAETAEAIGPDGWLRTGDIAEIDGDGYVRIVDRKKEIIINSAGKNMSPAHIESQLKSAGQLIAQACVIGDARPYNVALVNLDPLMLAAWSEAEGLSGLDPNELVAHERLLEAVAEEVTRANDRLARVEQIKRFAVIPGEWVVGGVEMTPTSKLKRSAIAEKYVHEIEALYTASDPGAGSVQPINQGRAERNTE